MPDEDIILNETPVTDYEDLASKIEDYYKSDINIKIGMAHIWEEAIHFYSGNQHIYYSVDANRIVAIPQTKENEYIPRPVTNKIRPEVRTIVSHFTRTRPRSTVRANSTDEKDKNAAKLSERILDLKWEDLHEDEKYEMLAMWWVITGTVVKKDFWDITNSRMIKLPRMTTVQEPVLNEDGTPMVDEGTGQPSTASKEIQEKDEFGQPAFDFVPLGDVNSSVVSPFNFALSPESLNEDEATWVMEYGVHKLDWIRQMYGKKGNGYTGLASEVVEEKSLSVIMNMEYSLRSQTGRGFGLGLQASTGGTYTEIKDSAVVKEYYERPTEKHPQGRSVVVANGKTLFSGDSPYYTEYGDWNPYTLFRYYLVPGRLWGAGPVEDSIPLQKRINAIDSLIILTRQTMAAPQRLLPNGCGVPDGYWTGKPGLEVPYRPVGANGAKPELLQGVALPGQVTEERNQTVSDLREQFGSLDVLRGQNPIGVGTVGQLQLLYENATNSLSSIFNRWEKAIERSESKKLKWIAKFYKEQRPDLINRLRAMNKDNTDIEIFDFIGADLRDNFSVKIESGSSIPKSKAAEQNMLLEMAKYNVLGDLTKDPLNKQEFLDRFGITGFDERSSPDMLRARWENETMDNGEIVDVLEIDVHEIHLPVHGNDIKRIGFEKLPAEIQTSKFVHYKSHILKLAEQKRPVVDAAARGVRQGQGQPPAGQGKPAPPAGASPRPTQRGMGRVKAGGDEGA